MQTAQIVTTEAAKALPDIWVWVVFYAMGLASMFTHAIKKWVNREIRGNLIDWYICHPRRSVGSLMAMAGGVTSAVLMGHLYDYTIGAQMVEVWGISYAADTINKQKT